MIRKRGRRRSIIVVLDGAKVSKDNKGVAPLRWALRDVVDPTDGLLVLTILISPTASMESSPDHVGFCCLGDHQQKSPPAPCKGDDHESIRYLHQQISQRREAYLQILRPYHERCKSSGVKFQVKVAAGFQPKEIVTKEANNVKPTWVIMDRCFAAEHSLQSSIGDCKIALVTTSTVTDQLVQQPNPESPELLMESVSDENSLPNFQGRHHYQSSPPYLLENNMINGESENQPAHEATDCERVNSTSPNNCWSWRQNERKGEIFNQVDQGRRRISLNNNTPFMGRLSEAMIALRTPLNLSWEEIIEIIGGLPPSGCFVNQYENFEMYDGYSRDISYPVKVKRFIGDSNGIVEVEKRVTSTLFHRNILGLIGYHESKSGTALVYRCPDKGMLDQYLNGLRGNRRLTFQTRMKIASEIGRGVRYMHEECPEGPIIHGNLQPYNIFLGQDFCPMISGFERAKWLQFEQVVAGDADQRCRREDRDPTEHESMELLKSDVFSFGVLLLRIFCKRSLPEDDKKLIEWARPLLSQGAFYELLDQDMEDLDMYEMYRVMSVATQCTKIKPHSRPSMTQVVSILRGENSCVMELSSSSDSSV